jgi:hypothetical protein
MSSSARRYVGGGFSEPLVPFFKCEVVKLLHKLPKIVDCGLEGGPMITSFCGWWWDGSRRCGRLLAFCSLGC